MPKRTSATGSELFIVDNSDDDWKVLRYLHDWCQISKAIDIATGYLRDRLAAGPAGRMAEGRQDSHPDGRRGLAAHQKCLPGRVKPGHEKAGRQPGAREGEERFPDRRSRHRRGHPFGKDRVPGLPKGEVPRQGLHHPRPAGSRRFLGPGRLLQFHLPGLDREHRTERPDHRPAGPVSSRSGTRSTGTRPKTSRRKSSRPSNATSANTPPLRSMPRRCRSSSAATR